MRRKSERATPKKAETTVTPRRTRRGRGARSPTPEEVVPDENQIEEQGEIEVQQGQEEQQQEVESEDEVIPLPKKRGRRSTRQSSTDVESTPTTKRRGRQRRVTQVEVIEEEATVVEETKSDEVEHEPEIVQVESEVVVQDQEIVPEKEVESDDHHQIEEIHETEEVQLRQQIEEEQSPEQPKYEEMTVDEESNAVSEVPSEPAQNEEESQDPPQIDEVSASHEPVAEESSKDSDVVEIQPAHDDFAQSLEPPSVQEDEEDASRESGEIVEEKQEEPVKPEPVLEPIPRRQRRKFMTHSSIQATRNERSNRQESVNDHEPAATTAPEEAPKELSEKQHQQIDDDTSVRVSNKKRSSRSKENDHNNIDVVTNTNNKTKSSIKSGGAEHNKNDVADVGKEPEEHNEEKENEPSATAAISAAPLPAGQRKRKWITQKSVENKPAIISISTDSLKELIPEVVPVPINDIQMDVSPEAGEIVDDYNPDKENNDQHERKRRISEKSVDEKLRKRKPDIDSHEKTQVHVKETLNNKEKPPPLPPSPPKQTQSNILYITNLVRPFTILQLKGLLARTGKLVENGFWMDKIKSKCFVKYETEE